MLRPAAATEPACPADRLGTERVLALSTKGGFAVGLKSYPRSLDLADHEVVLTFDDGPWPKTTPLVLAALAHECVRATFFLIGRNAEAYPNLVRRELAQGETIGHHTYSHPILRLLSETKAQENIEKGFVADDKAAYGSAGAAPKVPFFRFPGFADTPTLVHWLESRDIGIFGADLWAADWLNMTPDEERKVILARLDKAGRGILLLHDTKASTAAMLPALLRDLKARGYKIVDIVPGDGRPAFRNAPPGWKSEIEAILAKLLAPHAHGRKQGAHLPESAE
ncbi:MAG TPA: polysaccharide deacetylase family protein [Methylovirgula sp.]|nr:polysaccharide deacetylase family protein [Methylovirgula sp.]